MDRKETVYFVSKMMVLSDDSFSTDIMTYNLILGMHQAGYKVVFLCICESGNREDARKLEEQFADITEKTVILPSLIGLDNGKYAQLLKMLRSTYASRWYAEQLPEDFQPEGNALLIAHAPAIEGVLYCNAIRRKFSNQPLPYIQYWSDPVALSGITPAQYGFKRYLHRWIENKLLKSADVITYGTKPLMTAQQTLYPNHAKKMRFIDVSYKDFGTDHTVAGVKQPQNAFLYAGGYFRKIRNIAPLFEAVKNLDGQVRLDVYGNGDVIPEDTQNVVTHGRISPRELETIERSYGNTISLMNSDCVQIPGKTFYNTHLPQNILVILDGPVKEEIKEYLERYDRFVLCENNEASIREALLETIHKAPNQTFAKEHYSPSVIATSLVTSISKHY